MSNKPSDPTNNNSGNTIGGNVENSFNVTHNGKEPSLFSKIFNSTGTFIGIIAGIIAILAFFGIKEWKSDPTNRSEQTINYQILGTWQLIAANDHSLSPNEQQLWRFFENGSVLVTNDRSSQKGGYRVIGTRITMAPLGVPDGIVSIDGDKMTITESSPQYYGSMHLQRIDRDTSVPSDD